MRKFIYNDYHYYKVNCAYFLDSQKNIIKRNTWTGEETILGKAKNVKEALKIIKKQKKED